MWKTTKKYEGTLFSLSNSSTLQNSIMCVVKVKQKYIIGFFMTHTLRSKNVSVVLSVLLFVKILTKTSFKEKDFSWRKKGHQMVFFLEFQRISKIEKLHS